MNYHLLLTYKFRGQTKACEITMSCTYTYSEVSSLLAELNSSTDSEDISEIFIQRCGELKILQHLEHINSNPFTWQTHNEGEEYLLLTVWAGDNIAARIFVKDGIVRNALSQYLQHEIFEARHAFAESRRQIVQALAEGN